MKIKELWVEEAVRVSQIKYPTKEIEVVREYFNNWFDNHFKDKEIEIYNDYKNTRRKTKLSKVVDFYYSDEKPIVTEHGVMFNRYPLSPIALVLLELGKERKVLKKKRDALGEAGDMEGYAHYDLLQMLVKIIMNSYYGASGSRSSIFYNLHCALSTTGKGRRIVSTSEQLFEGFLANNSLFETNNQCIVFMKNCFVEYHNRKEEFDKLYAGHMYISEERVLQKLLSTYDKNCVPKTSLIYSYLRNLTNEQRCVIYYKNNLYQFLYDMREQLFPLINDFANIDVEENREIATLNFDKYPASLERFNTIWDKLELGVFYNYHIIDRVERLISKPRKVVIIIDTDSNMVYLGGWVDFLHKYIYTTSNQVLNNEDLRINSLTLINLINERLLEKSLYKFCVESNYPEERIPYLYMKNEYHYTNMIVSNSKKNYAGTVEFKEGVPMNGKLDIKGLAIGKISTNENIRNAFISIVKDDILNAKEINLPLIMGKLRTIQDGIKDSLYSGKTEYLTPSSVKALENYANPLSQQNVVAFLLWNEIYPDRPIEVNDQMFIIKIRIKTDEEFNKIEDKDIREICRNFMLNSGCAKAKKEGLYVIGLPRDVEEIPEWIRPFINVSEIVRSATSSILPILECLDIAPMRVSSNNNISGLISF